MDNKDGTELPTQGYSFDNVFSVMACAEQYQFCIPSPNAAPICTPFTSRKDLTYQPFLLPLLQRIHASEYQTAIIESIIQGLEYSSITYLLQNLDSPLLANNLAISGQSMPLASDQWVLESKNLFSMGLAIMQHMVVDYVTGPPTEYAQFAVGPGNDTGLNWLCGSQIVRSEDFINFSTLAIFLVFILGGLVIFVSLWLETAVGLIRARSRRGRWKQTAWWVEGTLQLQRQAFERKGIGGWEVKEWDQVPLAEEGKEFTGLSNCGDVLPLAVAQVMESRSQNTALLENFGKSSAVRVLSVTSSSEGISDAKRLRSHFL